MSSPLSYDHFKSFIACQIAPPPPRETSRPRPFVSVSREAGAGGVSITRKLAEFMNRECHNPQPSWTVFDRSLAEKVLEDHDMPSRIARYMTEDANRAIISSIEESLGLHPSNWTLVEKTAHTILKLAHLGNVIIVGRAANLITAHMTQGFHVRLVGNFEKRVERLMEVKSLNWKEAKRQVRKLDQQRRAYVRSYFRRYIENPTLYHLVINTDLVSYDAAAEMIGRELMRRMP